MLRCIITATADSLYASPTASSSSPQRYDSSCHLDYRHASIKTTLCSNEQSARLVSEGHIPRHLSLFRKRLFLFNGPCCSLCHYLHSSPDWSPIVEPGRRA